MKAGVTVGLAGVSLSILAAANPSQAQSETSTPQSVSGLEEIIVTARRREESLQDVPQTVNAVTAETVEKLNLLKFEDVQAVVPGLALSNNNSGFGAAASLRGVSFTSQTQTSPTVEFYLDDSPIESNLLFQSMFDIGQIEVLRGPQGTLRGRAAPSGSITVTSRRADLSELGGYVMATGTDQNGYNAQGAINVPIVSEKLAVRIAGLYDETEHDQVRSFNSPADPKAETKAARLGVAFQPSDSVSANVIYQRLERDVTSFNQVAGTGSAGLPGGLVIVNGRPRFPYPLNPTLAPNWNGPAIDAGDRRSLQDQPNNLTQKFDVITGNLDWRFAGQRVSYVGGYRAFEIIDPAVSQDSGNLLPGIELFNRPNTKQIERTHELRLASEERIAGLFDYTVGVFYSKSHSTAHVAQTGSFLPGAFGSPFAAPGVGVVVPRYYFDTLIERSSIIEEKSAFASVTWHITDATELSVGGRYIINERDQFLGVSNTTAFAALPPAAIGQTSCPPGFTVTYPGTCDVPIVVAVADPRGGKDKPTIYNVALSHHFTDGFMAYTNVGSSWRRGVNYLGLGINDVPSPGVPADPVLDQLTHLDPEKSRSYEIGFKSTFWDDRARVNMAVYHQDYDGLIYISPLPINHLENRGSGLQRASAAFINSANAIVDGVELDTSFQFTPRWNAALSFSYADGHVDDDVVPCNDASVTLSQSQRVALCRTDQTVSASPQWNTSLQSEYSMPVTNRMDGYIRGLLTYYPKNDEQIGGFNGFQADSYGLLNLYLGVRDANNAWDVLVFVKNATNTEETLVLENSLGVNQFADLANTFGQPGYVNARFTPDREIGLMVRYSFGSR